MAHDCLTTGGATGIDLAKVPGSTADVSIQTINAVNSSALYVSNFIMNGTFNGTGPLPTGAHAGLVLVPGAVKSNGDAPH